MKVINEQRDQKLRNAMHFLAFRSLSFYVLQTLWLLTITFSFLILTNNVMSIDILLPSPYEAPKIQSEAAIDALLGTIGSLQCGPTGLVLGTLVGALSGVIGYRQNIQKAEAEAEYKITCRNKIWLLTQIIKIQTWILVGALILAPLLWLTITKYNTRFFLQREQIFWLLVLYPTVSYLPPIIILVVMSLYILRITWRLRQLLNWKLS